MSEVEGDRGQSGVKATLDRNKVKCQQVGGSLCLHDPNGLGIELPPTG